MTHGWTVWDRIPVATRFSACPDRPWGPPSNLYNGYRIFPGGRDSRGVGLTPQPLLVPKVLEKSRAIPLLTKRACMTYKERVNTYLIYDHTSHDKVSYVRHYCYCYYYYYYYYFYYSFSV